MTPLFPLLVMEQNAHIDQIALAKLMKHSIASDMTELEFHAGCGDLNRREILMFYKSADGVLSAKLNRPINTTVRFDAEEAEAELIAA